MTTSETEMMVTKLPAAQRPAEQVVAETVPLRASSNWISNSIWPSHSHRGQPAKRMKGLLGEQMANVMMMRREFERS